MNKKLLVGFILSILALGAGTVWLAGGASPKPSVLGTSGRVKTTVPETSFDWGNISYSGGKATKIFVIKNEGTDILKLQSVKTSCTCTQAQVTTEQGKSPYFSMHGTSGWVGEVGPGKEAQLEVIFDPAFHGPSGVGPITRQVTVETNDAQKPNLEFSLKGVVVK